MYVCRNDQTKGYRYYLARKSVNIDIARKSVKIKLNNFVNTDIARQFCRDTDKQFGKYRHDTIQENQCT